MRLLLAFINVVSSPLFVEPRLRDWGRFAPKSVSRSASVSTYELTLDRLVLFCIHITAAISSYIVDLSWLSSRALIFNITHNTISNRSTSLLYNEHLVHRAPPNCLTAYAGSAGPTPCFMFTYPSMTSAAMTSPLIVLHESAAPKSPQNSLSPSWSRTGGRLSVAIGH
jgi:hypothetical protein